MKNIPIILNCLLNPSMINYSKKEYNYILSVLWKNSNYEERKEVVSIVEIYFNDISDKFNLFPNQCNKENLEYTLFDILEYKYRDDYRKISGERTKSFMTEIRENLNPIKDRFTYCDYCEGYYHERIIEKRFGKNICRKCLTHIQVPQI